jgi:hypothetical protein
MAKKIEIKEPIGLLQETSSQRILLEEFRALRADYDRQRNGGITRVNFFITSMSVVLGGALVFVSSNNPAMISYFRIILLAALIILVTIGLEIYNFTVHREISTDRDIRGLARIRNYFVKLDPGLEDYFVNPIYDYPTDYLNLKRSGMRRTTEVIVSFLVGIAFTVVSGYFPLALEINILIGCGAAIIVILILELIAHRMFGKALKIVEKEMKFKMKLIEK